MNKSKRNKVKLITKIVIISISCFILTTALTGVLSFINMKDLILNEYGNRAGEVASVTSLILDPDDVVRYGKTLEKDDKYYSYLNLISEIRGITGVRDIFVFIPINEKQVVYIFESNTDDENHIVFDLGKVDDFTNEAIYGDARKIYYDKNVGKSFKVSNDIYNFIGTSHVALKDSLDNVVAIVGVDISMDSVMNSLFKHTRSVIILNFLVLAMCFFILIMILRKSIVSPIKKISSWAGKYIVNSGAEDMLLDEGISSCEEIDVLSRSLHKMIEDIVGYVENITAITVSQEKAAQEMAIASKIQLSTLPTKFPDLFNNNNFDVYANMTPAKAVGGDFYDVFLIDENHLCLTIADVSGKGVPAALFMMITKILIKQSAMNNLSPGKVFELVNKQLIENNETNMFVTAFLGIVDINTGELVYCNAGHNPPLIKQKKRAFELLKTKSSSILGGIDNTNYKEYRINLAPGDMIYMYTDGVTEAFNEQEELYSEQRLISKINSINIKESTLRDIVETIKEDIKEFSGNKEQSDDITMLLFKFI